jgi:uncharacterized protein YjbJ (UPF0337 family)
MTSTRSKTEGKGDELKGKAREAWGNVTGDENEKAKGRGDQVKGHAKQAWGNVQEAVEDAKR